MLNFDDTVITQLCIHKMGNPTLEEGYSFSDQPTPIRTNEEHNELLRFFTGSFNGLEFFKLSHPINLQHNGVYSVAQQVFGLQTELLDFSKDVTKLLYSKSNHPKVVGGEVYVLHFDNVLVDDEVTDAIGIFKSESKTTFMKVFNDNHVFDYHLDEGINLGAIDKACLILNTHADDGYKVCIRDYQSKGDEAIYWKQEFLGLEPRNDNYHKTQQYMALAKNYVTEQLPQEFEVDRADQIDMLNKSVAFFKSNENFDYQSFTREVIQEPQIIKSFNKYKEDFQQNNALPLEEDFEISASAVKKQSKIFKSILKLDKSFHVYIHGNKDLIEKGYDEERNMNYYKLFYKEEA